MPTPPKVSPYRHHHSLTGAELDASIEATEEIRPAYIDNLVLQESSIMVASPPGQGKSAILLTMAAQSSLGIPVFGELACSKPLNSYIFCPERSARELKERLKKIKRTIPYNSGHLVIDDGMTGIVEIANVQSRDAIYKEIELRMPNGIDLFCVEGMYGMTRKPLASEEAANEFYRFGAELNAKFGTVALWYSHHTKRIQKNSKGEDLPIAFFGSQFLLANVTGAYIFERLPATNMSRMKQFKDTVSGLADELIFSFDPETFTTHLIPTSELIAGKEKLRIFVNACLRDGKTFTYDDLSRCANLSQSTIQRTLLTWVREGRVSNLNSIGKKGLYRVLTSV